MMKNILVIKTSLRGNDSASSQLADYLIEHFRTGDQYSTNVLDLAEEGFNHLTGEEMQAWSTAPEARSPQQAQLASLSDALIDELKAADEIVVALPMYNFDSPSTFKTWVDRVARAGKTFAYTENGPNGLVTGKRVTVIFSRGGKYLGTALDTQTTYINNFFNFIGLSEVDSVYAEGLAMGEESANTSISAAKEKINELFK